ncbi:hypothetical protein [Sphingosinicella sp. BN140058]|uniref:hypothetical protein n=1 Tax=Sphingosinicella sp. BN140058 TaxID=1892855 RepID=UPI001011E2AC|nr:hypothetical protein [Sphingosinicella sp. BN140058]QAY78919.1 hypothetical protein ETR14_22050 [Sphingosinicella sp. BN140058]
MGPTRFFLTLLLAWLLFYVVVPFVLICRSRVLSAGLVQLIGALLPVIWHAVFWEDETGTFGLLVITLLPLPIGVIAYGTIAGLSRASARTLRFFRERRGL